MIIQDLDRQKLQPAIALVNRVFPQQPFFEQARFGLPISLSSGLLPPLTAIAGIESVRYWVATLGYSQVVGITGLYMRRSEDCTWLGWTCVAPEHRGQGYGSSLLSCAIAHAKAYAKHYDRRYLRVYTSPEMEVALQMYKRLGFRRFDASKKYIYLELKFD